MTDTLYFYRQLNVLGRWCPRTSVTYPASATAEGQRIHVKDVQALPHFAKHLPLSQLERLYPEQANA